MPNGKRLELESIKATAARSGACDEGRFALILTFTMQAQAALTSARLYLFDCFWKFHAGVTHCSRHPPILLLSPFQNRALKHRPRRMLPRGSGQRRRDRSAGNMPPSCRPLPRNTVSQASCQVAAPRAHSLAHRDIPSEQACISETRHLLPVASRNSAFLPSAPAE
jgi:hypothetical protein